MGAPKARAPTKLGIRWEAIGFKHVFQAIGAEMDVINEFGATFCSRLHVSDAWEQF